MTGPLGPGSDRRPAAIAICSGFAGAAALSLWSLTHLFAPFRWVWLSWTFAFASAARLSRGRVRLAAANMAGLSAVLLLCELYLGGGLMVSSAVSPINVRGGPLGYAPVKDNRIVSRKVIAGQVVYDVAYSIDKNGFRGTPPLPAGSPAVVFFGDSFTFGEGVNDEEAFPAVFQAESGFKSINLAYRGYGPHQMLRMLETGSEIPATAGYRPFEAFYLFLPGHVDRAAGSEFWDPDGPRYEVGADGAPRYVGPWRGSLTAGAIRALFLSAVARWGWSIAHRRSTPNTDERNLERFTAIVAELRRVYLERYPGDFQVLFWDVGREGPGREVVERLRRRGLTVVDLKKALPELGRQELYLPNDGHPGAGLHRAVGLYLSRWVAERRGRK